MTKTHVLLPLILASLLFTAINSAIAAPASDLASLQRDDTQKEAIGFIGGAVLGAIVAGPPGAVAMAAFGLLGTTVSNDHDKNEMLTMHLNQSQRELLALQNQQRELQNRYQAAMREIEAVNLQRVSLDNQLAALEQKAACCSDAALSLHFTTNSTSIEEQYLQSLQQLVDLSRDVESPLILVSGFADPRGTRDENQQLSEQRVESVVRALIGMGIDRELIRTSAFGENRSIGQSDNPESYFFDRRVNVELQSATNELISLSN